MVVTRGKGGWGKFGESKGVGVKHVTEKELTLGGEHAMQYTDDVL